MTRLIRSMAAVTMVGAMVLGGIAIAEEKAPSTQPAYPLKTCVVSGEELGSMGDAHIIKYEGREVRFCCSACEKTFRKDPAKYLKKIDDAAAKAPTTQPAS